MGTESWLWLPVIGLVLWSIGGVLATVALFFVKPGVSRLAMAARGAFVQPLDAFEPTGRKLMRTGRWLVGVALVLIAVFIFKAQPRSRKLRR